MQGLSLSLCFVLVLAGSFAAASPVAAETVELHAAIETGQVSVRIEFLGGAMGDRMKVFLRKQVAEPLKLSVVPGTLFLPQGADVQRLAAVRLLGQLTARGTYQRTALIDLTGSAEQGFLIQVVCIDYHKDSPPAGQAFQVGTVDPRCQRILSLRADLSIWAYQSAIWMDRSGVSAEKLQGTFQVPSEDLKSAQSLLRQAEQVGADSLETVKASEEAKVAARGMFSADPTIRAKAYAEVQALAETDRAALERLLEQNVFRNGKLPSLDELRAGNSLASLLPAGVELPKLEIPQSVDEVLLLVEQIRKRAADGEANDSERLAAAANLRVMPHLLSLKSRVALLRLAAVRALPNVKSAVAVEALLVAIGDQDARVRMAAAEGLEKLTGQSFGEDAEKWTAWWQESHHSMHW